MNIIKKKLNQFCNLHKKEEGLYKCENCGERFCETCKVFEKLDKKRFSNHYLKLYFLSFKEHVDALQLCWKCFTQIYDLYNKDRKKNKTNNVGRDILLLINCIFFGLWLPISIFAFLSTIIITGYFVSSGILLLFPIIGISIFNSLFVLLPFLIRTMKKIKSRNEKAKLSRFFESYGNFCPICGEKVKIYERYCKICQEL